MSKFNDVKAGDVVLAPVAIHYGFNSSLKFLVQKKVDRVTNTQIIIGDNKYKKENGRVVGGGSFAQIYLMSENGTKISEWETISDQTQEYRQTVQKVKQLNALRKELQSLESTIINHMEKVIKNVELSQLESIVQNVVDVNKKAQSE